MNKIVLFGVRSPISVEYEETISRLCMEIEACVSVNNSPRVLAMSKVIELNDLRVKTLKSPFLTCAFDPARRRNLQQLAEDIGLVPAQALVDPTAIVASSARLDCGGFINAAAVIGAASIIGKNVLINRATNLGHHSLVGNYVSIGPGCTLASNVQIGPGAIIGAGTIILPDIRIGENAIIAAGSVVRKDVADDEFVAGNPAVVKSFDLEKSRLRVTDEE